AGAVRAGGVAEGFRYLWGPDERRRGRATETRFGTTYGYVRDVAEAIGAALRRAEIPPARVAKVALGAPEPRAAAEAAKRAGLDGRQVEDALVGEAGILGSAEPLAPLARSLETANPR